MAFLPCRLDTMKFKRLPSWVLVTLLLLQIAAVGYLDYFSGYEIKVGPLYAVTVAFGVWYLGAGIGVLSCLLCTGVAFWADRASGHVFSARWIEYYSNIPRLTFFLFVAFSFAYFRRTIEAAKLRLRAFSGQLPVCHQCHKVCGQDGYWSEFSTYLRENTDAAVVDKVCPDCSRRIYVQPIISRKEKASA